MDQTNFNLNTKNFIIRPTDIENVWSCRWSICTKQDASKQIGSIGFNGQPENGQVVLWHEITEQQNNYDNIVEVLNMMSRWAFKQKNVYRINTDSKCDWGMLQFIDFQFDKHENEGKIIFHIDKPEPYWSFIGLIIGAFVGEFTRLILIKTSGQDSYSYTGSFLLIFTIIGAGIGKHFAKKEMKRRLNIINGNK